VFGLDFEIPAGAGYQLRSGNAEPFLWREDDGAVVNYPYEIGSLASITGTTISGPNQFNYYYFFYNWRMSSIAPCLSPRTEFTVTVEEVEGLEGVGVGPRRMVGMLDVLGREVRTPSNQMVIILFSDGSVEKRFVAEHR